MSNIGSNMVPLADGTLGDIVAGDITADDVAAANVEVTGQFSVATLNTAPANATDTGVLGEIRWTLTHIYLCTATDVWVRAAIVTW